MSELRKAAEEWIKAEYNFRCGPAAYSAIAAKWYEEANDNLRRAITGKADVEAAAIVLAVVPATLKKKRKRLKFSKDLGNQLSLFGSK